MLLQCKIYTPNMFLIHTHTYYNIITYSTSDEEAMAVDGSASQLGGGAAVRSPFYMLSLDVPQMPLFRDGQGATVIPQVPLLELLRKFDGHTWSDKLNAKGQPVRKQYTLRRLPRYLVFHLVRFASSGFGFGDGDKNSTIVTFPVRNLEMREYLQQQSGEGDGQVKDLPSKESIQGKI